MMMPNFWDRVIRVRWRNSIVAVIAAGSLAVVNFAAAPDPLQELKAGAAAFDAKRSAAAISILKPLPKRLPKLADYAAWYLGSAHFAAQDYAAVPKALEPVLEQVPPSPLAARAVFLSVRALQVNGNTKEALAMLRKYYAKLPQPEADLSMASAFASSGDPVSAVIYYQRVYFGYPASNEAVTSDAELGKLKAQMGDAYPPAMPGAMLGRALKLLNASQTERGRKELEALVPQLGGSEKDVARVRIGVAQYSLKENAAALHYLSGLKIETPDADAERLYYILLCARRLQNQDESLSVLDRMARLYPSSTWRLQALTNYGNRYLVENQMESYEPLYRACYESFATDPRAADCQWKVAWGHYLRRRADAGAMLKSHLRLFPSSEYAPAALYFLGRLSEAARDTGAAKTYYQEIAREYPNYYYTVLARERLDDVASAPASPATTEFLRGIAFPERARVKSFDPNATAKARIERSRLLASIGLDDWAEGELRYGAQNEDQPHVLAVELATFASTRSGPDQAMRYIKRYVPGYLSLPIDSAPGQFWKYTFPLPFRTDLERFSKQNGLDPFLMAALVRQESEFNPKAVSRANARGLSQIMPTTGRELSRRLKLKPYSTANLFQPVVNLQLGSFYLRSIADQLDGRWEAALAAYNAGLSRARTWSKWGEFREPAEFIETVPFSETRNYIQIVLRNADVYRRLYAKPLSAQVSYSDELKARGGAPSPRNSSAIPK